MARPIDPRKSAAWQRRLQQFAAGGVMEIPEDRVDLSAFRRHRHALASAFAVYSAIATAFSSSLISFLKPCPLWCPRRNVLQVFPCGCEFVNCECEFFELWVRVSNLHLPSTR